MKPVIVATKAGWLIAAKLIRETPKAYIVWYSDTPGREVRIRKDDEGRGIFDNPEDALSWMSDEEDNT